MRTFAVLLAIGLPFTLIGAEPKRSTGDRMTPPTIGVVLPRGLAIGSTAELSVDGLNLTSASRIYFSKAGITGRVKSIRQVADLSDLRFGSAGLPATIDLGPLPPRMQVTFEVAIAPEVEPGPVSFRVQTPLGTTPEGKFAVERSAPVLMKDAEAKAPAILAGEIAEAGQADSYKIAIAAPQVLYFENMAIQVGSTLQPVVSIVREDGSVEAEYGREGGSDTTSFRHSFTTAGKFSIRVSDYLQSGKPSHFYRIRLSSEPPELKAMAEATDFQEVQALTVPGRVRGKLGAAGREHSVRFSATKGQPLVLEVNAKRSGSELDSVLEILDGSGKPVEIAVARAVTETNMVLNDRDSAQRGFRLNSVTGLNVGDYLMIGSEIVRLEELPEGPDADTFVEAFGMQRRSFFGTSGEAHHLDRAVYKVQIHPPGSRFSPNGLPLTRLYARNDDGGSMYGRDSYLTFTPPADGEYTVRIRDSRGMGGEKFTYNLSIRTPQPDFKLTVSPKNPNVPAGGAIPVTVTAARMDGFDGPIEITAENLPKGVTATPAKIAPGQVTTTLLLKAGGEVELPEAAHLQISGTAGDLTRKASPADKLMLLSVTRKPDITMSTETRVVEVEPGGTANITVAIQRNNNFGGRVPVEVRNLPPRVRLPDVGLNGVLLNENETTRTFQINALEIAEPIEQMIYVAGRIETRSESPVYAAPQAILLRVKPGPAKVSSVR